MYIGAWLIRSKRFIASFRIGRGDTTTTRGAGYQQSNDDHLCGHRVICPLRVLTHGYQRRSGRENVLPANAKCQRHSTGNSLCASLLTCGTTWHYSYWPSLVKIVTVCLDVNALTDANFLPGVWKSLKHIVWLQLYVESILFDYMPTEERNSGSLVCPQRELEWPLGAWRHECLTEMAGIWVSVRLTDMIAVSLSVWSVWLQFVVETRDSANVSTPFHMVE